MAKAKSHRSGGNRTLRRFTLALVIIIALVALAWWRWPSVMAAITGSAAYIWGLLGLGIFLVVIALAILVVLLAFRKQKSLVHRWNRWLSLGAFMTAAWAIFGLTGTGGTVGLDLVGTNVILGGLKVTGLLALGVVLAAPVQVWHLVRRIRRPRGFSPAYNWNRWLASVAFLLAVWGILTVTGIVGGFGLGIVGQEGFISGLKIFGFIVAGAVLLSPGKFLRRVKRASSRAAMSMEGLPEVKPSRIRPRAVAEPGGVEMTESIETPQVKSAPPEEGDARQVAQDVWKRYGKSDSLVQVDGWKLPPIDILEKTPEAEFSQADNQRRARLIEESLASYGVDAKVVQINTGPTVTQFGVEPGWDRRMKEVREKDANGNVRVRQEEIGRTRVKVERILSLSNDLALSLAASSIRIEAPVPGKSIIGIEVPNMTSSSVSMRGVIETSVFQKMLAKSKLAVALGKSAGGEAVVGDLAKMPHLLIAGATGSGKTVCLNALISCLLMNNVPSELRFIMVDPKRVELTPYNSIPHLSAPVITDASKAIGALRWLSQEMDRRYETFAKVTARNIEGYNKNQPASRMPYLVVIIDELADLMMAGYDEVERLLCRLAQLSRATGIHLVVATQRPSVDVITGLIKANFPTRISFAVTSQVDSRTILDGAGAEKLLGKGDMLYMPTEAAKPKRLQGCYLSDAEIERLVYFWNSQRASSETSLKLEDLSGPMNAAAKQDAAEDPLLETARQFRDQYENISASFLQRKLRIGYPRAARLMELLDAEEGTLGTGGGKTFES